MIYFCADDYGVSKESNKRIERSLEFGVLNKISVLPNGELTDFNKLLLNKNVNLALHLNLVEGYPLSKSNEVSLLISKDGSFKYSFLGLFLLSISFKKKELEKQLYKEIKNQIYFWKTCVEGKRPILIDSHQHTHMIPLVFKTLLKVIKDEGIDIEYLRIPAEPILPYIITPQFYKISNIIKHWLLNFLNLINRKEFKKVNINTAYFIGVMYSGCVTQEKIKKILPSYLKLANKKGKDIEIALHPGYLKNDETMIKGIKKNFKKFYLSPNREKEFNTLKNIKL